MRSLKAVRLIVAVFAVAAAWTQPADAQVAVGGRIGRARGSIDALTAEINGRVHFLHRAELRAGVYWLIQPGACADIWPGSYRCGYDGRGFYVGPSVLLLAMEPLNVSIGGDVGRFSRGGGFPDAKGVGSWSLGADAELRIAGPVLLQLGIHHRRVRDPVFTELFDDDARFTGFTIGLLIDPLARVNERVTIDAPSQATLPVYPNPGFGRLGCYVGPSLERGVSKTVADLEAAIATGPWLVLDSISAEEVRRIYPDAEFDPRDLQNAILLERADSLYRIWGSWRRTAGDSIVFREGTTFPLALWQFIETPGGLAGEGFMVSDAIRRRPDGTVDRRTWRWPVNLVRIDCERVPRLHPKG